VPAGQYFSEERKRMREQGLDMGEVTPREQVYQAAKDEAFRGRQLEKEKQLEAERRTKLRAKFAADPATYGTEPY
jgi:hypothetical protein